MGHILRVNGLDGTLLRQFGCECLRCHAPGLQANTSMSLISLEGDDTVHHLLFDIGHGVVDSLNASQHLQGAAARLDGLILTHWHPDHTAELNRLVVANYGNRKRRGRDLSPVPLYCRAATHDWLRREHGFLTANYLEPRLNDEPDPPGSVLRPLPIDLPGVTITPVSVSHYTADQGANDAGTRYASAAYVIETDRSKAVLLWDIDSENEWLANPERATEVEAVALLRDADLLFIDTTFWGRKLKRATHPSFGNVRRYARTLRPRQTLLMHLSGHLDQPGNPGWGWTNERWTAEARAAWAADGLAGDVRAPHTGECFALD
jgi:ribonuclease BN (tRNA processing enzyme)